MEFTFQPEFWLAVGQIIMIDILLGGDNAVVIALACRKLPARQRLLGILWGTGGAIVLRVVLIFFALSLLAIPFLKLIGALLLVWIGIKLLLPEEDDRHDRLQGSERLWAAVKTVIVADFVMSLDNVIAIAGSAEGAGGDHKMTLVIFGLLVSIPIIVWGSQLVVRLMDRFPIVITLGGMLLGWIAGEMAMSDPALVSALADNFRIGKVPQTTVYFAGIIGSLSVLCMGKWFALQQNREKAGN
jgi:YjbE family integral membrane protein